MKETIARRDKGPGADASETAVARPPHVQVLERRCRRVERSMAECRQWESDAEMGRWARMTRRRSNLWRALDRLEGGVL